MCESVHACGGEELAVGGGDMLFSLSVPMC